MRNMKTIHQKPRTVFHFGKSMVGINTLCKTIKIPPKYTIRDPWISEMHWEAAICYTIQLHYINHHNEYNCRLLNEYSVLGPSSLVGITELAR